MNSLKYIDTDTNNIESFDNSGIIISKVRIIIIVLLVALSFILFLRK